MFLKKFILEHSDIKIAIFKKKYIKKYKEIIEYTSNLPENTPLRQRYYHILNNIVDIPVCKMCTNKVSWNRSKRQYCEYCCNQCRSNNKELLKKTKQTNLERYGVEHPLQSKKIKEKQEQTMLKRHGVENPGQSGTIKEKIRKTNLKRYNVNCPLKSEEIKEKIRKTNLEKYGVEHISRSHISSNTLNKLNDKKWLIEHHHNKKMTLAKIAKTLSVSTSTITVVYDKFGIEVKSFQFSMGEKEVLKFVTELLSNDIEILSNDRTIIKPYELDIYIPEFNFAIEYNGEYWHRNSQTKDNLKIEMCDKLDIKLMVIWENQWINNKTMIENIIISELLK